VDIWGEPISEEDELPLVESEEGYEVPVRPPRPPPQSGFDGEEDGFTPEEQADAGEPGFVPVAEEEEEPSGPPIPDYWAPSNTTDIVDGPPPPSPEEPAEETPEVPADAEEEQVAEPAAEEKVDDEPAAEEEE
jgi:hypothetical protein